MGKNFIFVKLKRFKFELLKRCNDPAVTSVEEEMYVVDYIITAYRSSHPVNCQPGNSPIPEIRIQIDFYSA